MKFMLDVYGEREPFLRECIAECFLSCAPGHKARSFEVRDGSMILFWRECHENTTWQALPFELTGDTAGNFVVDWLRREDAYDGVEASTGDGSAKKGWHIRATDLHYQILSVEPWWAYYGK